MNSFKYTFEQRIGQTTRCIGHSPFPLAYGRKDWAISIRPLSPNFQHPPSACELSGCGRPCHEAGFHGRHDLGQCGGAMVCADGGLVPPLQKFLQRAGASPIRGRCTMVLPYQEGILMELDIAGALAMCSFPVGFHRHCGGEWRVPTALAIGTRQSWVEPYLPPRGEGDEGSGPPQLMQGLNELMWHLRVRVRRKPLMFLSATVKLSSQPLSHLSSHFLSIS
jgi:hypothetical protein